MPLGNSFGQPHALVIGAGVSGLTTALLLQRDGFRTTILAEQFLDRTTTVVAGALWEWPPAVCGFLRQHPPEALAREKRWCAEGYGQFDQLARAGCPGVHMRHVFFYLEQEADADPQEAAKIHEVAAHVRGFVRGRALLGRDGVVDPAGCIRDAYGYIAPQVDTDAYLPWLLARALEGGATLIPRRIEAPLAGVAAELLRQHDAQILVNCAGLGARDLASDQGVMPVRGGWFVVPNDGQAFPRVEAAHCTSLASAGQGGRFLFVLPRGCDRLILGGFADPSSIETTIDYGSSPELREVHALCVAFMPALAGADVQAPNRIRAGLRPFRGSGVRVEAEPDGAPVVHNYGHGGSGVTLSWGAAAEAAAIARAIAA
jgi:D-amino-acid oxidase